MANLSQDNCTIITKHPLTNSLDHLQDSLQKTEQSYKTSSLSFNDTANSPDLGPQKVVLMLLFTLQSHEVALDLHSKTEYRDIVSELSALFRRVQNGNFNYKHYHGLSQLVIKQASDVDIWNAVFDLITTVSWTTPPTSIPASYNDTSIMISSSSFQGSKQTQRIIKSAMFYEIKECMYHKVNYFFKKYFEGQYWSHKSKAIYNAMKKQYRDGQ